MSTRIEGQPVQPSLTPAFLRVSDGWQVRRRLSASSVGSALSVHVSNINVLALLIVRRPWPWEIRTRSGPWSRVRYTPVPLESVARATARHYRLVFDVKADERSKGAGDLTRRVASNDVSTDQVVNRVRLDQNAVDVSANAVVLYHVAAAVADQANAEVVTRRPYGTIPAKLIPPDAVVVAVDETVPTTRGVAGVTRVLDGDVVFDDALRHGCGQQAAEAIVMRGDVPNRDIRADPQQPRY